MNILISGANGYLGSCLACDLVQSYEIISLVRKTSILERINKTGMTLKYVEDLENVFAEENIDVVINTAALYGRNQESVSELIEANILFPQKLFQEAEKSDVKLFINIGTSLPSSVSFYAKTKNVFSELLEFQKNEGMKIIDLNLEHFYGFGDDSTKFTTYIFDACIKGLDLDLTEGTQRRDFVHVDDVVAAVKVIVSNLDNLGVWESIDVGSGEAPTVREFVESVKDVFGSVSNLNFGQRPTRLNEVQHSQANIKRLQELGWTKTYDLTDGLKSILTRYQS